MTAVYWTRSLVDWNEDVVLFQTAGLQLSNIIHVPSIAIRQVEVSESAAAMRPAALVITSANGLEMARKAEHLAHLWSQPLTVYTHSDNVMRALGESSFQVVPRKAPHARTARELADFIASELSPAAELLSLGAKEVAYDLTGHLQKAGYHVTHVACYETLVELTDLNGMPLSAKRRQDLARQAAGVICFASPSAVLGFTEGLTQVKGERLWQKALHAVAIGPTTAEACKGYFSKVSICEDNDLLTLVTNAAQLYSSNFGIK